MSEQDGRQATTMPRPTSNDDKEGWKTYWKAQGQLWRTEPEIDVDRQRYLAERRAIVPDVKKGIYPFKDVEPRLNRADIEWLLATHENGQGPVDWGDERQRNRFGLNLLGADLRGVKLSHLPLARMGGGTTGGHETHEQREAMVIHLEDAQLDDAHLEGVNFSYAHLERVSFSRAHLEKAFLLGAYLERADFSDGHLEEAILAVAQLKRADFSQATLKGVDLAGAHLEYASLYAAHLEGADLRETHLEGAYLQKTHLVLQPHLCDIMRGKQGEGGRDGSVSLNRRPAQLGRSFRRSARPFSPVL